MLPKIDPGKQDDLLMTPEMVSVIIVNYNGREVLEKCVQSVFHSSYSPLEVIIVDNSPNDGSTNEILKRFSVTLIRNKRNLGFARGNNQGLKEAKGEYILLLNNDATLHPRAIEELVKESKDSQCQILQPKILMADNHNVINSTGISIHLAGFPVLMRCGERDAQYTFPTNICAPHGACFLASKTVMNEIGLFDEEFVAFNEDTDFGWRALLMKKNIRFVPSAIVYHKWGHTYNQAHIANKVYLAERNRLIMILTNYQRRTMVLLLPLFILAECSTIAYCAFQGIVGSKIKGYADLMQLRNYLVKRRRWIQSVRKTNDSSIVKSFTLKYTHTTLGRSNKPVNMLFKILGGFLRHFI
jgi:GT2 family glycosyltransferase